MLLYICNTIAIILLYKIYFQAVFKKYGRSYFDTASMLKALDIREDGRQWRERHFDKNMQYLKIFLREENPLFFINVKCRISGIFWKKERKET